MRLLKLNNPIDQLDQIKKAQSKTNKLIETTGKSEQGAKNWLKDVDISDLDDLINNGL